MRSLAGYSPFTGNLDTHSSFTLSGCAEAVTNFLIRYTNKNTACRRKTPAVYHLEVTTTAADTQSIFPLSVAQLERVGYSGLSQPSWLYFVNTSRFRLQTLTFSKPLGSKARVS
jgi:hypothetical protein